MKSCLKRNLKIFLGTLLILAMNASPAAASAQEINVELKDGRTVSGFDGAFALDFEEGAFKTATALKVSLGKPEGPMIGRELFPVSPLYVMDTGGKIPEKPAVLTIKYDEKLLGEADPRSIAIYHECSDTAGKWIYVGGTIDPVNHTVTASISKIRRYAILSSQPVFSDLAGHWGEKDVKILAGRGLIGGMGNGKFQPDRPITRAELVSLVLNLVNADPQRKVRVEGPETPTFSDVKPGAWYYNVVETAYRLGIIKNDGRPFRPDVPITREEMAVMAVKALKSEDQALPENGTSWPFKDFDKIAPGAVNSVLMAYSKGLMRGVTADCFDPQGTATRAQAAAVILKALERNGLLTATSVINGTLRISEVEGTHFELRDTDTAVPVYVLIPGSADIKRQMEDLEDWKVRVTVIREGDASIYMTGPVLRVLTIVGTCGTCAKD